MRFIRAAPIAKNTKAKNIDSNNVVKVAILPCQSNDLTKPIDAALPNTAQIVIETREQITEKKFFTGDSTEFLFGLKHSFVKRTFYSIAF
jgi:hypothetical protein